MTDCLTYDIRDDTREHKHEIFAPLLSMLLDGTPLNANLVYLVCEYGCAWMVKWTSDDDTRVTDPPRLAFVDYQRPGKAESVKWEGWIYDRRRVYTTSRDWWVNAIPVYPIDLLSDGQWRTRISPYRVVSGPKETTIPRDWQWSDGHANHDPWKSHSEQVYQPQVLYIEESYVI
jgi:hypothetical protein